MDRKETAERIKIMQAFVDGKQIEFKDSVGRWCEAKNPLWNWDSGRKYRIKPEPKYRPFKDAVECWQEMQKHQPFGWIKGSGEYKNISGIRATGSYPILINVEHCGEQYENSCNMSEMFKNYTFADGSIFGIKEE